MATTSVETDSSRRDFLYVATGAVGVVGVGAVVWPLIDQMNPDASTLALASVEVDISKLAEGQEMTVKWHGKPVFIRHRTAKDIAEAKAVDISTLRDNNARNANAKENATAADENRTLPGKEQILVMIGVCTHLGCIPTGHNSGEYDGWFCPCHGSQYDTAGRIRKGPAPENLAIPPYAFLTDTKLKIG